MSLPIIQSKFSLDKSGLNKYSSIAILVDENTKLHCYAPNKIHFPPHYLIEVSSGEKNKNLDVCQYIWNELTRLNFDRHSLLIILGGGVLGDMGGFCAATYKRGIDFIIMPTTLLSQVDASVGGKLGIDFGNHKNHIGLFQNPVSTIIISDFIKTLPLRELRSGFAEIIKHCLIADKNMWNKVSSRSLIEQDWLELVKHSLDIKLRVVGNDPIENGERKILNFGHTIGHAIEGFLLLTPNSISHGEAIAAGMIMESYIAFAKNMILESELENIAKYILSVYGKIIIPKPTELIPLMQQDKKNVDNKILMSLLTQIGKATWDIQVRKDEIDAAMNYYLTYT